MARKNAFVRMGRPPAPAGTNSGGKMKGPMGAPTAGPAGTSGPMAGFSPSVPAAAFSRGGSAGYKKMPAHHDDPKFLCKGGRS